MRSWNDFKHFYPDEETSNPLSEEYLKKNSKLELINDEDENQNEKGEIGTESSCAMLVSPKELFYIERAFENRNFSVVEEIE
jgi:hypothetical protein